jgi:hypothetical protein
MLTETRVRVHVYGCDAHVQEAVRHGKWPTVDAAHAWLTARGYVATSEPRRGDTYRDYRGMKDHYSATVEMVRPINY